MSDAPERILVEDEREEGGNVYVTDVEKLPPIALEYGSQYIRADIAEKRIQELEAENRRIQNDTLEEAAKVAEQWMCCGEDIAATIRVMKDEI